jgi:predicted nuclease with TOPRIM domain
LHLLTRNGTATFEDDDEEEELVWEEEDQQQELVTAEKADDGAESEKFKALLRELESKDHRIKSLESENSGLHSKVKSLQQRISVLEESLSAAQEVTPPTPFKESSITNSSPKGRKETPTVVETSSIASSEGSSVLLVNHPTEAETEPEKKTSSTVEKSGKPLSSTELTQQLASLDDEDDEDGWS